MEIKTISAELKENNNTAFDNQVNAAIKEGFKLSRREIFTHTQPPTLYAELVKMPQPKPLPTWVEAVKTIKDTCRNAAECAPGCCPMFEWCEDMFPSEGDPKAPMRWTLPEVPAGD